MKMRGLTPLAILLLASAKARADAAPAASAPPSAPLTGVVQGAAAMGLPEPAPPAPGELDGDAPQAPFVRGDVKLAQRDLTLLQQAGYRFDDAGLLYGPDSPQPMSATDFAFTIEDLRSRKKLQALLRINLILNRYEFKKKKVPAAERQELKGIASENWELLSKSTRRDLKYLFTNEELFKLDLRLKGLEMPTPPAAFERTAKAPVLEPAKGWTEAAHPPVFPGLSPLDPIPPSLLSAFLSRPPVEGEAPASPIVARASGAAVTGTPPPPPSMEEKALPPPWGFRIQAPAPPPVASSRGFDETVARVRPVLHGPPPPPAVKPPASRPQPVSIVSLPGQPNAEYPAFDAKAFAAFLAAAPYGKDVKALLELVAAHGRDPERRVALGALQWIAPHVLVDSQRAGNLPAAYARVPDEPNRLQLAIGDGAVLTKTRGLFGGGRDFLLPDSPDFYKQRGLPPLAWKSADRTAPSDREEDNAYGRARVYSDGSRRTLPSSEQLAGVLLKELLRLDASLRGWDADPYRTELRITAAQMRFYADFEKDTQHLVRLDKETLARRKAWIDRPEEHEDFILQALSARRVGWVSRTSGSPRDEVAALADAGVVSAESARRAAESLVPTKEEPGALDSWIKGLADATPAQAAWIGLEKRAREK
ncbi:MAG TPA: hypothetical protein VNI01_06540 [Elusimicrobiota bacterium]|jgi:hypothetical protein|nr:hypothetical protein [Elusimicrobiota bacterium]